MNLGELYEELRKLLVSDGVGAAEGERALEADDVVEYRFNIRDAWERRFFFARCRRYELEPFRYVGQNRGTVMLQASRRFVDEVLWPEHVATSECFVEFLDDVTTRVVEDVFEQTDREIGIVERELDAAD